MEEARWPTLDGYTLTPLMAVDGDAAAATAAVAVDPRPDFTVSQFHGDNIAMSWFLVVKEGVNVPGGGSSRSGNSNSRKGGGGGGGGATSTFKLILWGTGKEVPSLLFDLLADPMEDTNLIADAAGAAKYAQIVDAMEQNLQSVVDYKNVAMEVAKYGKLMMVSESKKRGFTPRHFTHPID